MKTSSKIKSLDGIVYQHVYTIATVTHEVYGHGDSGDELRICCMGPYGGGGFPPVFLTHKAAEDYRQKNLDKFYTETKVVDLKLNTTTPSNV